MDGALVRLALASTTLPPGLLAYRKAAEGSDEIDIENEETPTLLVGTNLFDGAARPDQVAHLHSKKQTAGGIPSLSRLQMYTTCITCSSPGRGKGHTVPLHLGGCGLMYLTTQSTPLRGCDS